MWYRVPIPRVVRQQEEISDSPSWLSIGGNRATRFAFRAPIKRGTARSISTEPVNRSSVLFGEPESASRLAGCPIRGVRFVTEVFNAARLATIAIPAPVNHRYAHHPTQHNGCSYVHHLCLSRREGPAPRKRPLPARADRHHGQRFRPQARKCAPDASDARFSTRDARRKRA